MLLQSLGILAMVLVSFGLLYMSKKQQRGFDALLALVVSVFSYCGAIYMMIMLTTDTTGLERVVRVSLVVLLIVTYSRPLGYQVRQLVDARKTES